MDDLAALIIKKLREDDGPRRGTVALASWWYSDERLNLMVQPVVRNGRMSYNILKSKWQSIQIGNARWRPDGNYGWAAVSDDQISALPPLAPVCNFLTLEQTANFLLAMGKSGECPIRGGVGSMVVGVGCTVVWCCLRWMHSGCRGRGMDRPYCRCGIEGSC